MTSFVELMADISGAGQFFANSDCSFQGERQVEEHAVKKGQLKVKVAASEVVIVYLE